MATIFLTLLRLIFAACLCASLSAVAAPSPAPDDAEIQSWINVWVPSCNASSIYQHDCQAVFEGAVPAGVASSACPGNWGPGDCWAVKGTRSGGSTVGTYQTGFFRYSCPVGWSYTGGQCVCAGSPSTCSTNGPPPPDSQCPNQEARNAERAGSAQQGLSESAAYAFMRGAAGGSSAYCVNGCVVMAGTAQCGGLNGVWWCQTSGDSALAKACGGPGIGSFDGSSFAPMPNASPGTITQEITAEKPPAGKCPGTINGVQVWVPCDSTASTSTSTSSATSTTPVTSTGTVPGGSGTVTVTKSGETVCDRNGCTTTYKTTSTMSNPDGKGGTTSTTAQGTSQVAETKAEYCKRLPSDPTCSGMSGFSGDCKTAWTCNGDAVQCATAKAVNDEACLWNKETDESKLFRAELAKSQAPGSGSGTGGSGTIALSSNSFDRTELLGGGNCIQDLTVTVAGRSVTLPLSRYCSWLAILGNIGVALSFLVASRIVGAS